MAKGKMKAWYDDIDAATLQRIKTYSAFNDAKSKNLMIQTMYEYREKEIQDLKETNHELAETCIARKKRIAELEKKNAELKQLIEWLDMAIDSDIPIADKLAELEQENAELKEEVSFLKDNLRVARKDREELQLDVAKGLKEFVKDYPATALRYLANEKYIEQLTKAKEIILKLYNAGRDVLMCRNEELAYTRLDNAINDKRIEQFLKEVSE